MRHRLAEYITSIGMKPSSFARMVGVAPATMLRFLKGESVFTSETLSAILEAFPDLSAEWLLRGTGEMLLREDGKPAPTVSVSGGRVAVRTGDGDTYFFSEDGTLSPALLALIELISDKDRVIREKDARIAELCDKLIATLGSR